MTATSTKLAHVERLKALTLEELFLEAERFGRVGVFSSSGKRPHECYQVNIKFRTQTGTTLEASSEFDMTLRAALTQAIQRASLIAAQFK